MEPSEQQARSIEQHRSELERQIETIIRAYEEQHKAPIAVEVHFSDGMLTGSAPDELRSQIGTAIEAFHNMPAISGAGIRVERLTAMDSDADGTIALRVTYDYPGY